MAHRCQTYLIINANGIALRPELLSGALRQHAIACVLLSGGADTPDRLRAFVTSCQQAQTAVLIAGDAALALETGADGVHMHHRANIEEAVDRFRAARAVLGSNRIVGAGAGLSRHDAMVLAELGADYVALGEGVNAEVGVLAEHVGWWAEMFEVPCVAWAARDQQMAAALMAAGADFVAAGQDLELTAALSVLAAVPG